MNNNKLAFIQHELCTILSSAPANIEAKWGKMNFIQMIEHLTSFFQVSTNKLQYPLISEPEHLLKLKAFLLSDKPFRENTKAPVHIVPEEPMPPKHTNAADAIQVLQEEINYFVAYYSNSGMQLATHPVFGELNFNEWVLLHDKHVMHHCRQFGLL